MHVYVCIQIHTHSLFLKNYILLLDIWRFCFSQCLIVPGKLQGKQYCKQGMQEMKVVWLCREQYFTTEIV